MRSRGCSEFIVVMMFIIIGTAMGWFLGWHEAMVYGCDSWTSIIDAKGLC